VNIADHATGDPQSPALIVADWDTISYGELYQRSQRVAGLLHDRGLRRGDGVALVLPNRSEFLEITWGCQLSGLYYTAVNTHFTPDEVGYVIDDSDARAVFVDASIEGPGTTVLVAGNNVQLSGWGALDGTYMIETAQHHLTRATGYSTSIAARRVSV